MAPYAPWLFGTVVIVLLILILLVANGNLHFAIMPHLLARFGGGSVLPPLAA